MYGTYGHLNAAHDNAILLPSHYMADHQGYRWLIGAGHALDTTKLFLIATELFGNGHSSSPSNTPEPFHGPRFPITTIRDNVEAVHRLLLEDLKITHLKAVIGFSMGAQQAFQWAVSYPNFADRIVATSGTSFEQVLNKYKTNFIPGADANNLILQMRTWEQHDVGTTAGFIYAICYRFIFPCGDTRQERQATRQMKNFLMIISVIF